MSKSKLKKISAYVPEIVFDEIQKYSKEKEISISQSIIAGLVAGFGIPEAEIEGRGRKIIISSDKETKEKVLQLEQNFQEFSSNITSQVEQILSAVQSKDQTINRNSVDYKQSVNGNDVVKNQSIDKLLDKPIAKKSSKISTEEVEHKNQQFILLEAKTDLQPFSPTLLASRIKTHKNTPANYRRGKSTEEFKVWSSKKDPDRISWIPNPDGNGYLPSEDLTEAQLLKLQQWLTANS